MKTKVEEKKPLAKKEEKAAACSTSMKPGKQDSAKECGEKEVAKAAPIEKKKEKAKSSK